MKVINKGKGGYGYSYVITIPLAGKDPVKERHNFWFESYARRDAAFNAMKNTIPNTTGWKKVGR